jgi:hypothetical protein
MLLEKIEIYSVHVTVLEKESSSSHFRPSHASSSIDNLPLVRLKSAHESQARRGVCSISEDGWPVVAIAAEGMTHNGKSLLRFRSGAFVHAAPVVPVCISYRWRRVNPAWTISTSEAWHILRLLTQFVNVAEVSVLPAYFPEDSEVANAAVYAENVRRVMVRYRESRWSMHYASLV